VRVLVTGASRGIGRETALLLARQGAEVALHAHEHLATAETLARELAKDGHPAFVVRGDLGKSAEVDHLAQSVEHRWDSLDVLIQNAGTYPRVAFADMSDEELRRCLEVNLLGPIRLTRRLLGLLQRSPAPRIIFVSSILAFTGSSRGAHYAAAKAGLVGFARSLARELAPRITVNVVAPGAVDTEILAGDTPERRAARIARIPLRRIGTPREIANAIAFLASPEASYVTGATLHVNGGLLLE
jgi:3-oxoacyl-[acyl-carrier protein] reductase